MKISGDEKRAILAAIEEAVQVCFERIESVKWEKENLTDFQSTIEIADKWSQICAKLGDEVVHTKCLMLMTACGIIIDLVETGS